MFTPINLRLPLLAVPKARARITRSGHAYTPKKTKVFERSVQYFWNESGYTMIPKVATAVTIVCFLPKPKSKKLAIMPIVKPDIDNFAKGILDSLTGYAWADDNQITDLNVAKRYSQNGQAAIFIKIEAVVEA